MHHWNEEENFVISDQISYKEMQQKMMDWYDKASVNGTVLDDKLICKNENWSVYSRSFPPDNEGWNCTAIIIRNNKDSEYYLRIFRNYHTASAKIITANGKEYLLCGEDYQGLTVVDLTERVFMTYIQADRYKHGACFCITDFVNYDPDEKILEVEGCYWGFEYNGRKYRFDPEDPTFHEDDMIEEWYLED